MGRRKKEPREVHRKNISESASILFMEKGLVNTSMDEIAKKAGYSKATIYVYFENKEEIVNYLVLESMTKLYDYVYEALKKETIKEKYLAICFGLLSYQEEFPYYFNTVVNKISFKTKPSDEETYLVGEKINELLIGLFSEAIKKGQIKPNIDILQMSFSVWGMLTGLIQMATNKKEYIEKELKIEKNAFLKDGFEMIFHSLN